VLAGFVRHALQPYRLVDTRPNSGQGDTQTAGQTLTFKVSPSGTAPNDVPWGATAVVVNITAVNPTDTGYPTAFAAGQPVPFVSTVNPFATLATSGGLSNPVTDVQSDRAVCSIPLARGGGCRER
jgi:hypothetical protein